MSQSVDACNEILALEFNATAIAGFADNAAVSPVTNWYVSLHSANPGTTGDQTVNELSYGGYARIAVVRTTAGWSVPSSGQTKNVADIIFASCVAGSGSAAYVGLGTSLSGVGRLRYAGPLAAVRLIVAGVRPIFIANALVVRRT